jgi:23S rRNA (cytidine1920-2'-O)/16S rRNA (cytidine1409-2'-O)-methyltransferase
MKRRRPLSDEAPVEAITAGRVRVDGAVITNPDSMVLSSSSIVVEDERSLRGDVKLKPALNHFGVKVKGRIALDVGAAAGGFTKALLDSGARRVYAVDAGHGQLLGSLRQDPRVVNLESTNLANLTAERVPEELGIITLDLSYLSLTDAMPQLAPLRIAEGADLIALVKPMFELGLREAPTDEGSLGEAILLASKGIEAGGWQVMETVRTGVTGAKGAVEGFVHATKSQKGTLTR